MAEPSFFLTGDFNHWHPGSAGHRFQEVVQPYGRDGWGHDHPHKRLRLGSYHLTVELPPGRVRFKVLEGRGWERQWTTQRFHDREQPFEAHRFRTRCGLAPGVLVPRGGGPQPPHAEVSVPGGPVRFDLHPGSRTLTVHAELGRAPGPRVTPWRSFGCGPDALYDTWVATPYGYDPRGAFRYPLGLLFDGRSLLFGEDPRQGRYDRPARQLPRVFDLLTRHGLIPPAVLVGVEVPRRPRQASAREPNGAHDRQEAFVDEAGPLHRAYVRSLLDELLPALAADFPLADGAGGRFLLGHSWGGDFALRLLAHAPARFGAAVALSPSEPGPRLEALRGRPAGAAPRVALLYGLHDLGPFFLTRTAGCGPLLRELGLPHLLQACPASSHDPETLADALPAALAFALG